MTITIGLFGTCGDSTWRSNFTKVYNELGISYFNPQVPAGTWTAEHAVIEAKHLANDKIILFPVTSETYGTGSLAETGFSIIQAIKSSANRYVIVQIDKHIDRQLEANAVAAQESLRARALILAHLKKIDHDNVFIVPNLDSMLRTSIRLHSIALDLKDIRAEIKL